jgi:hypothetical protein
MTGVPSTSTTIKEDDGELEEAHKEGDRWWGAKSWTISLVARTSSTCKRVTGEGSGFRGAIGTGGKPGVGVSDAMNSGDMCEDPGLFEGVRAERGERVGGGVAIWQPGPILKPWISFGSSDQWEEGEGGKRRKKQGDQTCIKDLEIEQPSSQ